jgi:hypothetical protein
MSREAHVRICERLGSLILVDSTFGLDSTASVGEQASPEGEG